jgi:K(+)-stimulated pyrophosphate-energized sodium pump
LAVELAVRLTYEMGAGFSRTLAAIFFVISLFFVYRSFYGMRIKVAEAGTPTAAMPVEADLPKAASR